jgi:hypothetical protein
MRSPQHTKQDSDFIVLDLLFGLCTSRPFLRVQQIGMPEVKNIVDILQGSSGAAFGI